jgi:hypothetical protein
MMTKEEEAYYNSYLNLVRVPVKDDVEYTLKFEGTRKLEN